MPEVDLVFPRAYVEFVNPADESEVLRCDLTWLTSSYKCIFGEGCCGIYADAPDVGCCTLGAHFSDKADQKRVATHVAELTAETWQFHPGRKVRRSDWVTTDDEGEAKTLTHEVGGQSACVFANRNDFAGGAGCALHIGALEAGERPLDWKPNVCWQVPIRLEHSTDENGHLTSRLREWKRRDWGEGGEDFHWWCTESPEAFVGDRAVYQESRDDIVELVGQGIYDLLVAQLERPGWTPLPHPALRR